MFSNDPAAFGQILNATFQLIIELEGRWGCHGSSLVKGNTWR
ncbi:hypothetical protein [Sinorhizobium sp. A49]|nr:hypothetical protein [Sinorhizobium sp. A49]